MSEPNDRFTREKWSRLNGGKDLSRKGCIDEPIVDLVALINDSSDYYTTSSCSGRVIVVANNDKNGALNKKKGIKWLFVSHKPANSDDIIAAITAALSDANECPISATFKFEPFILHVCCGRMAAAKALLSAAIGCGFRNSGISVGRRERIIVAVRSCHSLEVPVVCERTLLVSHDYIARITAMANDKLSRNFDAIRKFHLSLKSICEASH